MPVFEGIIPAVPSIFNDLEVLKTDEIGNVVEFLKESGVNGVAFNLLGGEFYKLTANEKIKSLNIGIELVNGNVKVITGISEPGTLLSCELAKLAEDAGADGLIAMPPYYSPFGKLDNESIFRHFGRIAASVNIPLILQDFDFGIPFVTLKKLREEFSNIVGIKIEGINKKRTLSRISELRSSLDEEFSILGGMLGRNLTNEIEAGSSGTIPGSSLADFLARIYSGIKEGDTLTQVKNMENIAQIIDLELSDMRNFVYFEKIILEKRRIIENVNCRNPFSYPRKAKVERLGRLVGNMLSQNH